MHQVAFPDQPAVAGIEATGDQVGHEHVDLAVADGRRGPRPVATAGRVTAAVAFADGDIGEPAFLAGGRIQGQADFPRVAIDFPDDLCKNLATADGEGTEARMDRLPPGDLGAVAAPLDVHFFRGNPILVRPAVHGPVGRVRQGALQEEETLRINATARTVRSFWISGTFLKAKL